MATRIGWNEWVFESRLMASVLPGLSSSAATTDAAWIASKTRSAFADKHRHLLVLRFALVNIIGFSLVGAAHMLGYIEAVLAADQTRLSVVIAAVFLAGLVVCAGRVVQTGRELNLTREFDPSEASFAASYVEKTTDMAGTSRALFAGNLRLKLSHRITIVRNISSNLVVLGLVGTVIGFIIALSGVDPDRASDFASISPMVSTLINGMSTALYTTLVGAVLSIWLMINYHLLATGTVKLITAIIELGERHGRD